MWFRVQTCLGLHQVALISCVTSGKLLNTSVSQILHLQSVDNNKNLMYIVVRVK